MNPRASAPRMRSGLRGSIHAASWSTASCNMAGPASSGMMSLKTIPGKLPWKTVSATYALEYGENTLELHADAITDGARVLVHDDLLATGGTAAAICDLVEQLGGKIVGLAFAIELEFLEGRKHLEQYDVHSLITY